MKKSATGLFVALMAGAVSAPVFAAADPDPAVSIESPEDVVIRAKRMKLYQLRMEMVEVENRFYAKYNELNTDDQFDVSCTAVALTGEIRKTRQCRPVFLERFEGQYAAEVSAMFDGTRSASEGPSHFATQPAAQLFAKYQDMKSHVIGLINQSPELKRMVRHREALEKSYQEEQKVRLNGRLILVE